MTTANKLMEPDDRINEGNKYRFVDAESTCVMTSSFQLKFIALSKNALPPTRGSIEAAGVDLRSAYGYIVPANGHALIATDLRVILPPGTYGRLASRSGLAWKNLIDVRAGVIDRDYTGNVKILIHNLDSTKDFFVKRGDRIAQMVCEKIETPEIEFVEFAESSDIGGNEVGAVDDIDKGTTGISGVNIHSNAKRAYDRSNVSTGVVEKRFDRGFGSSGIS